MPTKNNRKQAIKAAALVALLNLPQLIPVEGCGDLDLYVKRETVGEVSANYARVKALVEQHAADGYTDERWFAADIYDEDGEPYFDLTNPDDMALVRLLPVGVKNRVYAALDEANGQAALKNLLAAETSS